ncbi:MAG TPA: DUF2975 domain-containing protein [Gammaproteobacteria bacterium]|nr:DUF2975 domain-containing protein [Gammaproteobacteria bacterium]
MNRIKKVSLFFRLVFQIIFVALPILLIISWIYAPNELVLLAGFIKLNAIPATYSGMHAYTAQGVPEKAILHALTVGEKSLGCLVSAIPMMVEMFILYSLIKLFKLYEKGEIFSINHVRYIRNIGYALLTGQLIEPFYQFVMGLVLTLNNPPHHRYAAITLDQTNIGILLTALLVILISWIMAEGCKLREEQQLTI